MTKFTTIHDLITKSDNMSKLPNIHNLITPIAMIS